MLLDGSLPEPYEFSRRDDGKPYDGRFLRVDHDGNPGDKSAQQRS